MRHWILVALTAVGLTCVVIAGWLHLVGPLCAGVCAVVVAGAALLALLTMRDPDRHSAGSQARIAVGFTLVFTWAVAAAIMFGFAEFASEEARKKQDLFALLLILVTNVGGFLALTRSVRTRSETAATLRELSALRVATLGTPIVEHCVSALEADTVEELIASVARMLRLAVSLPLTREVLDKAVLWVRDDGVGQWFILASSDLSGNDLTFTMRVVSQEAPGAGIVANLAVAELCDAPDCFFERDVFVCRKGLPVHPWYLSNPGSTAQGMAAVLLRERGIPVGVLSLTTRLQDVLPVAGPNRSELIDIMRSWSHSFVVPVRRLRSLQPADTT